MYQYLALPVRVVDGDTVKLQVDCGFRMSFTDNFRLWGIDSPEMSTLEGPPAKEFLQGLLFRPDGTPRQVLIETSKQDKYGRWVCKLWLVGHEISDSTMINNIMVYNNQAVEYMR